MTATTTTKQYCNSCGKYTNHRIIHKHAVDDEEYDPEYECSIGWHKGYTVYQCLGCDEFFIECWKWFSEWDHGSAIKQRFPAEKPIQEPNWLHKLPEDVKNVVYELYKALQNDCPTLACSGIRTVLDRVFVDKVGDVGDFPEKIKKMIQNGYLGESQKSIILSVIKAGSASAHRAFTPDIEILKSALSITENLLQSIYIHPEAGDTLEKATPPREPKK